MATESNLNTPRNSSEEIYNFTCTLCAKRNKHTEAVQFCVECQEYLCPGCMESHNIFSLMSEHVLQKVELTSTSRDKTRSLPYTLIERCPKHEAEIIKMFCALHDQVACTVCMAIDHKSCNDIQYIPHVAGTLHTEQANTDIIMALLNASEKMKTLKEMCNKALDDLNTAKQTTLEAIQKFREELNNMLDKLEHNTKQQLDDQYRTQQRQWQVYIEKGTAVSHNLQKRLDQLLNTENNTSQQFILTKIIKENISLADTISKQLQPSSIQITFSQSKAIKSCLEQLSSLGDIHHTTDNRKLSLYKVKRLHKYNVKTTNDIHTCYICGSCVLDSGHLLLADNTNKKLKLFDRDTNAVTIHCTLPDSPIAVCTVSDVEVAVSLGNKMLQLVSVSNGLLLPTRILKLDHYCHGLAIAVDKMYITSGENLYVHELNGKLLRTINKDQSGQKIFSSAYHLTVSNNGNIHVTDFSNGLITLDSQGQVVWKYSGSDLAGPFGICTDGFGNVFVCGTSSCNVLQLGQDGQKLCELVTQVDSVSYPRCLLFDKKNCRLIVTCSSNDNILAFSLEYICSTK